MGFGSDYGSISVLPAPSTSTSTCLHSQGAAHKGIAAMITADIHGDVVCGGASDGSCTVWNLKTCREQARLTGHQQKVRSALYPCHVCIYHHDVT